MPDNKCGMATFTYLPRINLSNHFPIQANTSKNGNVSSLVIPNEKRFLLAISVVNAIHGRVVSRFDPG